MLAESGPLAGALLGAAGGLLAAFYRLRAEYDATGASIAIALAAGATPLTAAVVTGRLLDTVVFAALAALALVVTTRVTSPTLGAVLLVGSPLLIPLLTPAADPAPTLFTAKNGFLALTPVVYIAVIGAATDVRKHPAEFTAAAIALILWPLTETSLIPAVAFLLPGLARAIDWSRRKPLVAVAPLVLAAIVWNYWLMVQYTVGTIPKDAPVSFAAMVRQQADVHTRSPYVYPFAWPGNLFAAWRAGIPLSRYDALAAEAAEQSFELTFDRRADRFLLDGWGPLASDASGPFRPIVGGDATLVFPLEPQPRDTAIHVLASLPTFDERDTTTIQILVNNRSVGQLQVSASTASEIRFTVSSADVGGIFRAGYNRLSIVSSGPAQLAVHRIRIAPSA